ncbi:plasmid replication protein RepC [uncultured Sulfitobacter sp.]|uniref:plasmid replication protein RepC n=1 Tax=uncultured Sulfitobacter sp. TaxID=191468 RepID=UPI002610A0DE|nr:plasmid replication protein RepC [uncultured Sulfitobacter sp.]
MDVLTTTPFGQRQVTAGLMERAALAQRPPQVPHSDKWELFRELTTARLAYGVTDRDLTVLNALLSFHPDKNLSDNASLIVFPSNRSLAERAHGMAESTLRRHLGALVRAGIIARHDSPNGKRYAARDRAGEVTRAFGFDLRPLLVQAGQIAQAAQAARDAAERLRRLREDVSLLKRDAAKLAAWGVETGQGGDWSAVEAELLDQHRAFRRKLSAEALEELRGRAQAVLKTVQEKLRKSDNMSGSDVQNERHYSNSKPEDPDLELCSEETKGEAPNLPLAVVLKACPDILPYAGDQIRHWHQLVGVAATVRGMMGISPGAWEDAQRVMGAPVAAVTVAGILQRVDQIKSPGGYLRALTRQAQDHAFSPGPMIMALLRSG